MLLSVACAGGSRSPATAPQPTPAATAVVVASGGPQILPLLVSSEITKGPNRFLFSITDQQNKLVAAPDVNVHLVFYDADTDPNTAAFESDARFLWAIEGQQGLYAAQVTFPDAGRWATMFEATFPDGAVKSVRASYDVRDAGTTPAIGAAAPAVTTPIAADVGGDLAKISTDDDPDPRFYETSIDQALAARKPFVVTFATPLFCETRLCGPTLETVKSVAKEYPGVTFINVEPYKLKSVGEQLQPDLDPQGQLQTAPWTDAWGLPSEPYTFVVASDGTVRAKFEGVLGPDELRAALDGL